MKEREVKKGPATGKESVIQVPNAFYLDGEINERSRREFCALLDSTAQNSKDVAIIITSRGGAVDELSLMIDQMDRVREIYGTKIITIAQGYAYSGGAILVALGDTRYAFPHTTFYLHDVQLASPKEALNIRRSDDAQALRQRRYFERKLGEKTHKPIVETRKLWDRYLNENQALEAGLIDGIIGYAK